MFLISSLNWLLLFIKFSSLILASSNLASIDVLYSSNKSLWPRSSFFSCLFSLSNSIFLWSNSNSVETCLRLIFVSQEISSSFGWTPEGMTSLVNMHKGVFTSVLLAGYWQHLLASPEDCSEQCLEHQKMISEVQTRKNILFLSIFSTASHSFLREQGCFLVQPTCSVPEIYSHTHLLK